MIIDKISNALLYEKQVPQMAEILEFAKDASGKEAGTYPFPWGKIMIQEGHTRHHYEADFEFHEQYLDIQWMLEGKEQMEWMGREDLKLTLPYSKEKDIGFGKGLGSLLSVPEGTFYLVYPGDAHKPCCHSTEQTWYKKMVVKIRVA